MSTLSDLQKKLQEESEGIMFPFRASVKSTTVNTTQPVLDTATDGIMSVTGKKYVGPDSVIQYSSEGQRQLKEIEKGMLPQFDQSQFPDIGKGKVEDRGGTAPLPVDTTPIPQPEAPSIDPCPPGFRYDPVKKVCVPVEQPKSGRSDRDKTVVVDRPRNIGKVATAIGSINEQIAKEGPGTYGQPVTYTIDNSNPFMALIPGGTLLDTLLFKPQKDKAMKDFAENIDGMDVVDKDGKQEVTFQTEEAKTLYQRAMTEESLKGNIASTQKTNPDGSIMRDEFGRAQIVGPISMQPQGKVDEAYYNRDFGKLGEFGKLDVGPTFDDPKIVRTPLDPIQGVTSDTTTDAATGKGYNIQNIRPYNLGVNRQDTTQKEAPRFGQLDTAASRAASGADEQRSLMTDSRRLDRVAEPAGQQPDFLGQEQTERDKRKQREAEQKAKIGYGQNIDQDIINANKKDSDREAQRQTGDSTMRAVTDRYGNPIRTTSGKVVTNPAPKSGGGGGSSKIVCTMMNESYGFGSFRNKIWLAYGSKLSKEYEIGYHTLFLPLVKYAKQKGFTNIIIKNVLEHIAIHRTVDIRKQKYNKVGILGRAYRLILEPLCYITGRIKLWKKK